MKLTVLGSGTHIPVKNRSNPAYLLDIGNECLLLDCGSGTLRQIARANRSEWEIDKIFLSHLHIDHTMDLVPMFFTYKYQQYEIQKKKVIPIFAHPEFSGMIKNIENIYGKWINGEKRQYRHFSILPNQSLDLKTYRIDAFPADHTSNSIIFRFTDNKNRVFVYSGDTAPTEDLIRAAYRADLLLIEASCPENCKIEGHLSAKEIKTLINSANPKKTVITHLHPENDSEIFKSQFKSEKVVIAEDLDIFRIQP